MHELSICTALLQQVQNIAKDYAPSRVDKILLKVGPLSGVEAPLLMNAYPLAAAGTPAAKAELVIETSPVCVRCTQCGAETEVPPNRMLCGRCGDFRTRLVSGDEILLVKVELTPIDAN